MDFTKPLFLSFLWIVLTFIKNSGAEQLKLSDLPQLKKWEIPAMPQKYAMRTGRKFKNIDRVYQMGRKRSSHWSIAPELNFREVEMEEDSEKIKLDHNYKAFLEDDDAPDGSLKTGKVEGRSLVEKKSKALSGNGILAESMQGERRQNIALSKKHKKDIKNGRKNPKIAKKIASKRNKKPATHGKFKVQEQLLKEKRTALPINGMVRNVKSQINVGNSFKNRGRTSFKTADSSKSPLGRGSFVNSSAGQASNSFSTADLKSHIGSMTHGPLVKSELAKYHTSQKLEINRDKASIVSKREAEMEEVNDNNHPLIVAVHDDTGFVSKRAAENDAPNNLMTQRRNSNLNEAVLRARIAMNLLQNKRQITNKPNLKPSPIRNSALNGIKMPRSIPAGGNAHKNLQQTRLQDSKAQALRLLKHSVVLGKGQNKNGVLGDTQSKGVAVKARSNIPARITGNNETIHARSSITQPTQGSQNSSHGKIVQTPRAEISKPKEKIKIAPANVARAVAMAMEQLKRDRMWGKVFVHVLPSGKLKVMVQETKKMPDE